MSKRAAFLLLLLLLLARSALVLSLADVFLYGEELGKGAAAKAMIDGLGVEHSKLNYVYHEGGGFLVTHLKALAFLLVGENLLAHKLVALLTTSILFLVGLRLVDERFGSRAAVIFGLLFVLCPLPWQCFSLLSLGTHFEALILIALILRFTMRILEDDAEGLSDWAWLGVFSGLGLYVSLQCAAASAAAGLCLLAGLRRRLFGRGILVALAGFAVGAAPLWWMMGHVGLAAIRVQGHEGLGQGAKGWSAIRGLLRPLVDEPDVFAWSWVLAFLLLVPAGWRRSGRPIAAYLALFLVLYVASGFAIPNSGHWFFWLRCSPLWFGSTVLLAASLANLWERSPRGREVAVAAVALLLVSGAADFARLLFDGRPGMLAQNAWTLRRTKGYDYTEYFDKFVHHLPGDEESKVGILRRFDDDPRYLYPAIGHSLFERSSVPLDEAIAISRRAFGEPNIHWGESLLGLGLLVSPDYGRDLDGAFARIEAAPLDAQPWLAEALGRVALGLKIEEWKIDAQCRVQVDPRWREPFLRGAGWRVWKLHRLRPERAFALIERQGLDVVAPLLEGYMAARAATTLSR